MRVLSSEIIKCVRTRKPSSCLKGTEPIWESSGASETLQGKEQSSEAVSPTPWPVLRAGPPAQWEPYPGMGIPILSLASFSLPLLSLEGWLLCAGLLCSGRQPSPPARPGARFTWRGLCFRAAP